MLAQRLRPAAAAGLASLARRYSSSSGSEVRDSEFMTIARRRSRGNVFGCGIDVR